MEGPAAIGGRDAAHALSEMIGRAAAQGSTLQIGVRPLRISARCYHLMLCEGLFRYAESGIKAEARRGARPLPELISILIDLLDDLDRTVVTAFALGGIGKIEAREVFRRKGKQLSIPDGCSAHLPSGLNVIADDVTC